MIKVWIIRHSIDFYALNHDFGYAEEFGELGFNPERPCAKYQPVFPCIFCGQGRQEVHGSSCAPILCKKAYAYGCIGAAHILGSKATRFLQGYLREGIAGANIDRLYYKLIFVIVSVELDGIRGHVIYARLHSVGCIIALVALQRKHFVGKVVEGGIISALVDLEPFKIFVNLGAACRNSHHNLKGAVLKDFVYCAVTI